MGDSILRKGALLSLPTKEVNITKFKPRFVMFNRDAYGAASILKAAHLAVEKSPRPCSRYGVVRVRIRVAQAQWVSKITDINCHDSNLDGH